jgi:hypothetical protein
VRPGQGPGPGHSHMGAATSVAARSLRTPCALDARYGQETIMKEILNTILDPSSQTEDFAAPLPEAYRAVACFFHPHYSRQE